MLLKIRKADHNDVPVLISLMEELSGHKISLEVCQIFIEKPFYMDDEFLMLKYS